MGRVAEKKKELILERSKKVFIEKGFANVMMKDIVDACGISRGGLYLYFSSTKEVFLTIFHKEAQLTADAVEVAMWEKMTAKEILIDTINVYKDQMMSQTPSMAHAVYEFFLENAEERMIRKWQFDGLSETIREILDYGINRQEFNKIDTSVYSRQIALFLDGMVLTMPVLEFPEKRIDEQISLLLSPIFK